MHRKKMHKHIKTSLHRHRRTRLPAQVAGRRCGCSHSWRGDHGASQGKVCQRGRFPRSCPVSLARESILPCMSKLCTTHLSMVQLHMNLLSRKAASSNPDAWLLQSGISCFKSVTKVRAAFFVCKSSHHALGVWCSRNLVPGQRRCCSHRPVHSSSAEICDWLEACALV